MGNRKTVTYTNGTVAEYTYDTLNRLTYLENRKSTSEIISSYTYTLGPAGNRTRVVEDSGRVVDYTYDNLYRLTQEAITDSVLGNETISYTYDAFGNRLTKTDSNGTTTYTYDANDRLLTEGGNSYTYDDNGNTLSKTDGIDTITHIYDYVNRLISVQTPSSVMDYIYDADGIRVSSTVDAAATNYLVDKNRDYAQVLEERDGAGSLIVGYTYGDDLISQHRGGAVSYYHYDAQSSTRILTNAAETVTDTYTYDAFGSLTDQAGVTANNYLYTGEQYDPNMGFYYLRARYYNPDVGRFTVQDPWDGNVFEPVSLHRYLYANCNPVMFRDPGGLIAIGETNVVQNISSVLRNISVKSLLRSSIVRGANLLLRVKRFFWDPQSWRTISREYWRRHGPAQGKSLHHWLFERSWTSIPQGLRNAGFNLVRMPRIINFPGGLNSWMGFASRWGGSRAFSAMLIQNGIRVGIPVSLVGGSYASYEFFAFALDWAFEKLGIGED